jgi:hypothetical protein
MIAVVEERHARVGIAPLCDALGLARATFYRRRAAPPPRSPAAGRPAAALPGRAAAAPTAARPHAGRSRAGLGPAA